MKYSNVYCRRNEEINTFARTRHIMGSYHVIKSWAYGPGVSICLHRKYDSIDCRICG